MIITLKNGALNLFCRGKMRLIPGEKEFARGAILKYWLAGKKDLGHDLRRGAQAVTGLGFWAGAWEGGGEGKVKVHRKKSKRVGQSIGQMTFSKCR